MKAPSQNDVTAPSTPSDRASARRRYSKPTLERIRLQPEEAVLSACKNPGWGGCEPPGQPPSRRPGS